MSAFTNHAPLGPDREPGFYVGSAVPACRLQSSSGAVVDLSEVRGQVFLLFYAIALPEEIAISHELDDAYAIRRGTDMLLRFNDALPVLKQSGVRVYGISVQAPGIQTISAERLGLRFPLLSDERYAFARAFKLPMTRQGRRMRFPVAIVDVCDGVVQRILDPVDMPSVAP